jgi:hypothetical protein
MLIFISRTWRLSMPLRTAFCAILLSSVGLAGQSTAGTGAIRGIITDSSNVGFAGAKVTVTNKSAGIVRVESSSTGEYSSGPLFPGEYNVRVEAKGFKTMEFGVTVRIGTVSPADVKLQAGKESEVVRTAGEETLVNTIQATLQTVFPSSLIDTLPVSGRNYLDVAQLAPGVQLEDAGISAPSKVGFSTVSIQAQSGRGLRF